MKSKNSKGKGKTLREFLDDLRKQRIAAAKIWRKSAVQ
jgi:hypothetical protein